MTPNQAYEILKNNSYKDITEKQNCLDIIKTNPQYACYYAINVIKGRWPEYEESIKNDPYYAYYAYFYANEVIKGRWIEGEESIKKDPQYACDYANYVIKGRWIEGEGSIKNYPEYACDYANEVIKGRWIEGEESIKSSTALVKYCKFINQRLVEKEHLLKGRSKIDYYIYFNITLPEEDLNKEIANGLIGKKSKYLAKVQKEKTLAIKHIKNLIDLGLISENDCIKNLINNQ